MSSRYAAARKWWWVLRLNGCMLGHFFLPPDLPRERQSKNMITKWTSDDRKANFLLTCWHRFHDDFGRDSNLLPLASATPWILVPRTTHLLSVMMQISELRRHLYLMLSKLCNESSPRPKQSNHQTHSAWPDVQGIEPDCLS